MKQRTRERRFYLMCAHAMLLESEMMHKSKKRKRSKQNKPSPDNRRARRHKYAVAAAMSATGMSDVPRDASSTSSWNGAGCGVPSRSTAARVGS